MNLVKKAAEILNPGQVPIITVDQPLFTIAIKSSGTGQQVMAKISSL